MTTEKKPRELPSSGGSYKRHASGLKQVEGSTADAPPYYLRNTKSAEPAASKSKPKAKAAPARKAGRPAKPVKAAKAKGGNAATANVEQNTASTTDAAN